MTERISWRHFPAAQGGRTLAIFYLQVDELPPICDSEAQAANDPSGRLEIYFVAGNFGLDLAKEMNTLIQIVTARREYHETVHHGVATGATAALIAGSLDPLVSAVFAFAPRLSFAISSRDGAPVSSESLASQQRKKTHPAPVHVLTPCGGGPGNPAPDPWRLASLRASGHLVLTDRLDESVLDRLRLVQELIARGNLELPPNTLIASDTDRRGAVAAHLALTRVREAAARPIAMSDTSEPASPLAPYWWARSLGDQGRLSVAWPFFARAPLVDDPPSTAKRAEIAVATANAAMKLSFSEVALGFCRHARALHPSYETAWFSEAALLGRLGRGHEFEAFKDMFRQRFGEDGLFNKLKDVVATDMRTREQRTRDFLARDGVAERFGKTVGVETRLSDALVEGTHWRHFPATGERPRTLAIFYAPVELRPPTLPYFRTVGAIACASLLINPGTNNFFQDCIESTTEIIHRVCRRHGYEETIHFGYSMGATAALRFGTADPLCRAIFALSPHLVLDRPFSRTADLMNPKLLSFDPERSRETSLLSRLENCPAREIHLFISCLDPQDGVQVRDALSLRQGPAQAHFLMEHHFLASIHRPADMIGDWLRNGRYTLPSDAPLASPIDQRAAIAAYDAMAAARDKEAVAIDDDLEMARTPTLPFCRAVALLSQDKPEQAWLFAAQALEGPLSLVGNLYGVLTTARRSAALLGWNEIAVGYYVEARSREPWYEEAWLLEASSLASAGRQGALEALLSDCRILHGDKALLATLSEIAASAVPSQAL